MQETHSEYFGRLQAQCGKVCGRNNFILFVPRSFFRGIFCASSLNLGRSACCHDKGLP
jgi:hypothetical protein